MRPVLAGLWDVLGRDEEGREDGTRCVTISVRSYLYPSYSQMPGIQPSQAQMLKTRPFG